MIDNTTNSPECIQKRLEKLRRWQEQQQQILIEKQNVQREVLSREHKEIYEKFGFEADSHQHELSKQENSKQTVARKSRPPSKTTPENKIKRPFLKRGEGLKSRFKIDPDEFRLHNLPKYKYANSHRNLRQKNTGKKKSTLMCKLADKSPVMQNAVEDQEHSDDNIEESYENIEDGMEMHDENTLLNASNSHSRNTSKLEETVDTHLAWSEVLRSNPAVLPDVLRQRLEDSHCDGQSFEETDDTSLFELLEKKILLEEGLKAQELLSIKRSNYHQWKIEDNQMSTNEVKTLQSMLLRPRNIEFDKDCEDQSETDESECEVERSDDKVRVRFADEVQVSQIDDKEETDLSMFQQAANDTNVTSEKSRVDSLLNDSTIIPDEQRTEILKYRDLLKSRLADLEKEISDFQKHNAEVLALKQQYEMEKARLMQEYLEMKEKLDDDRVKLEIYLHDERIKIDESKTKYEKLIKEARNPNRREREEISKLKEEVDFLKNENKAKESKHVAAQARLRAQIRNMEKDVKELGFEVDHLKKEKKRLESENAKMMRQNNNKMLQEINKSIAKLAVKKTEDVPSENKNAPVRSTKYSKTVNSSQQPRKSRSFPTVTCIETESPKTDESSDSDEDIEESRSSSLLEENSSILPRKAHCAIGMDHKEHSTSDKKLNIDFKREIENADGSKDIWYPNGNLKKISADGMFIRMLYYNKDIKETNIAEGTVKYYYYETNTWHTTYLDGLDILEFPNGQTEHRYKNGTLEVHFPNGSIRITNPNDDQKVEEWKYPDGASVVQMKTGDKILNFPNGQREVHTKDHKRREYPDGTVKIVYPDGSQETRYSNGRVRVKNKDGKLVLDSGG